MEDNSILGYNSVLTSSSAKNIEKIAGGGFMQEILQNLSNKILTGIKTVQHTDL